MIHCSTFARYIFVEIKQQIYCFSFVIFMYRIFMSTRDILVSTVKLLFFI